MLEESPVFLDDDNISFQNKLEDDKKFNAKDNNKHIYSNNHNRTILTENLYIDFAVTVTVPVSADYISYIFHCFYSVIKQFSLKPLYNVLLFFFILWTFNERIFKRSSV